MGLHPGIGHNGGPALAASDIYIGEKFLPLFEPYRHKALFGGRGSAKSHTMAGCLTITAARMTKRVVCARQFQNSIKDSVKELIESKIKAYGLSEQFAILEREIVHRKTDSRFTFIGLDRNPESAKSLEGADICWVEEARTINKRSMEILIPTIRKPGSELWWCWNPEQPEDPVDDYFRGNAKRAKGGTFEPPPNSYIMPVGIEDNPWFYHTAMPQEMWHMKQGNFKRYQHIWLGDYDNSFEGKIFTNVEIGRIEVPDHIPPRYGMDFGFSQDPNAIVKLYVNHARREIYIAREAGGRMALRDLPVAIRGVVEDDSDLIKADGSRPESIDHLNSLGFNVVAAKKGPGSVKTGITWLQGYRIVIDPECEEMRDEARLYSWQKDRLTGKALSVPVDAHNHYWDAVRYATEDCQTEGADLLQDDGGVMRFSIGGRR
jgi:phage terminase large subunit